MVEAVEVESIKWNRLPNVAEWLLSGPGNGRTNLDVLAELLAKNKSLIPQAGSELEALLRRGFVSTNTDVMTCGEEMIDYALVKYGTAIEFLKGRIN